MGKVNNLKPQVVDLRRVEHPRGMIMHALKASDENYFGFGEAYFSSVNFQMTKGWKLHKMMTLNLIVPHGDIRFIVHDGTIVDGENEIFPLVDIVLGNQNYSRLTIPPGHWVAFRGIGRDSNILLNIADIEHDSNEAINKPLENFNVRGLCFSE